MNIVGVDACKMGWCVIGLIDNVPVGRCFQDVYEVVKTYPNLDRMLIDIPIGLSSKTFSRTVDSKAREHLNKRKSSIFSPSCREALYAETYKAALKINREICGKGISIQAYNIGSKIKEVDEWFHARPQNLKIYEAHPELCFKSLNQNQDLKFSKHEKAGIEERKSIIFKQNRDLKFLYENLLKEYKRIQLKPDDILDAMALYLINKKSEKLRIITDENTLDETGKKVGIVYG